MTRDQAEELKNRAEVVVGCVITYTDKNNATFDRYMCKEVLVLFESEEYVTKTRFISDKGVTKDFDAQEMLDTFAKPVDFLTE
ncbi:MAG: hypothetical protein ABIN80_02410 [Dyadobacter sp.]|uniref:hypothetical protein n=1 Tax=Dyadobacter sp. TaxID=1914288 RepID=UPI0032646077